MFLRPEHGLRAIRVVREERFVQGFEDFVIIAGERHVLLFVYRLQFCVEETYDGIGETVCLNLRPVLHLV